MPNTARATTKARGKSHQNETGASDDGFGKLESAPAPTDTDADGLPDFWEQATGSDPRVANHNDPLRTHSFGTPGNTRLEEYLHFLASPHGVIISKSSLQIDLRRYTLGFPNQPRYEASQAMGGTVTIASYVANFTPTPGFAGRAEFQFTVRDADGSVWTQNLLILVQ
jgi:hypothetical protein